MENRLKAGFLIPSKYKKHRGIDKKICSDRINLGIKLKIKINMGERGRQHIEDEIDEPGGEAQNPVESEMVDDMILATRDMFEDAQDSIPAGSQSIIQDIIKTINEYFETNILEWKVHVDTLHSIFEDYKSGLTDDADLELEQLQLDVGDLKKRSVH